MKFWSKEEENILLNLDLKNIDIKHLSEELGRTEGSVIRKIYRLRNIDLRNKQIGTRRRALNRYKLMLRRTKFTDLPKNKKYKGIKVRIDKEEFIKWFMENDFYNASVDRIDKNKDYTMDNIQLIPLNENIAKDKIKEKDGYCECYKCHEIKPVSLFVKDKRRTTGHSTICLDCERKRSREKCRRRAKQ